MYAYNKKIVKFNGGLGNQMFQYAFGCALAGKLQSDILFDFAFFEDVKAIENVASRVFELEVFDIKCEPATKEDLNKVKKPQPHSKLERFLMKRFPKAFGINYIQDKNAFVYNKNLLEDDNYIYYEGYFQNERYFKHLKYKLLMDFSIKIPLDERNQAVLDKISEANSVSIHIRRGDYVNLDYVNKIHGVCSLDYYQRAIDYIAKNTQNPHFFVFSDDIEWVIKNLKIDYPFTLVDFNHNKGWFDMNLMKNCKHNIVANSSFSWWGAWLNQNPDKIVIAPKKWMNKKQKCDIVPKEWVKL